jgi:hypothetical protein
MLERTNHHSKDRSGKIDWTLEVEEGWVPHNIFSVHFLKENKVVIHMCDPAPEFMHNNCSLCQSPFGPEGAITLGQCCHAFHVTCIAQHSLRRSVVSRLSITTELQVLQNNGASGYYAFGTRIQPLEPSP